MVRASYSEFWSAAILLETLHGSVMGEAIPEAVSERERSIDWEKLLPYQSMLSSNERVLFDLAMTLWRGRGDATIPDLFLLERENLVRALEAIGVRRGVA